MIANNNVQPEAVEIVAIDLEDALAPWQTIAEAGGTPRSWAVRDRLNEVGANGSIDPSRKSSGLWRLVLSGGTWRTTGLPCDC
ncbi:hypothetical protein ACTHQN_06345 [Curtobacterium flaccumfaciens]|uniref:hypothetical protein n=1 Tax=Curtobacterium flaccumfaciens TaxID=2035 RepID=UPI003F7F8368